MPGAGPSYFFGHTYYSQPPDMQGDVLPGTKYVEDLATPPLGPTPYQPFGPLQTSLGLRSVVTELGERELGIGRITEYRVTQPATVTDTPPLGVLHQRSTTLYVWADREGRIVRILSSQMVDTREGGAVTIPATIPATSRTTVPAGPDAPVRIQRSVTSTFEEVTLSHFGISFNPSVPATSP